MPTLQIEHSVRDFDAWKQAFDSDPLGRERAGVRGHRIFRPLDDPSHVVVDLEFGTRDEAESFRGGLENLWRRVVEEGLITSPKVRILEAVESAEY